MKRTSLRSGTRRITQGSEVSRVAAMIGSTAFFAPLMVTSPCKGTPPLINRLSMKSCNLNRNELKLADQHPPLLSEKNVSADANCSCGLYNHQSRAASVVLLNHFHNPLLVFEDFRDRSLLAITELEHEFEIGRAHV